MSEDHSHRHHHAVTLAIALIALLAACALPFMMRDRLKLELRETSRILTDEQKKLSIKIDSMNAAIDGLSSKAQPDEQSMAELKRNVAETSTMVEVIGTRLDEMEKKAAEKKPELAAPSPPIATPAPAVVAFVPSNAFSVLKLAVLGGAGYASELAAWEKAQAPGSKAPEALSAFAQSGIPTEASLMRDLRAALALTQKPVAIDDVSVAGKINTHLAGLIKIKKATANDPYAAIHRDIDRAELQTLVRDVEQLDEPARAPLADWLKTAKTRADALAALGTLESKGGY